MEHISKSINNVMESIMEKSNSLKMVEVTAEKIAEEYDERVSIIMNDAGYPETVAKIHAKDEIIKYHGNEGWSKLFQYKMEQRKKLKKVKNNPCKSAGGCIECVCKQQLEVKNER
jgi:hypothetical protein